MQTFNLSWDKQASNIDWRFFCFLVLFILYLIFFAFFFHLLCYFSNFLNDFMISKCWNVFVFAAFFIFSHKNFCRICINIRMYNDFRTNFGKPNILTMGISTFLSIFYKYLHSIWRLDLSILPNVCRFFSILTKWVCAFIVIRIPCPCINIFW